MTIAELINIAESRIRTLLTARETAVRHGDMQAIADIDNDTSETADTLAKLRSLQ